MGLNKDGSFTIDGEGAFTGIDDNPYEKKKKELDLKRKKRKKESEEENESNN